MALSHRRQLIREEEKDFSTIIPPREKLPQVTEGVGVYSHCLYHSCEKDTDDLDVSIQLIYIHCRRACQLLNYQKSALEKSSALILARPQ